MFFMSVVDCCVASFGMVETTDGVTVDAVIGRSGRMVEFPFASVGLCGAGDGAGLGGCAITGVPFVAIKDKC